MVLQLPGEAFSIITEANCGTSVDNALCQAARISFGG